MSSSPASASAAKVASSSTISSTMQRTLVGCDTDELTIHKDAVLVKQFEKINEKVNAQAEEIKRLQKLDDEVRIIREKMATYERTGEWLTRRAPDESPVMKDEGSASSKTVEVPVENVFEVVRTRDLLHSYNEDGTATPLWSGDLPAFDVEAAKMMKTN